MPASQLCSFCYGAKLSAMKSNPYGAYDSNDYKVRYDYIVKTCGLPARDTNPSTGGIQLISDTYKCPGKTYVVKTGDTCDSIAKANLVSSGSMYEINPLLLNCSSPTIGLNICLPPQCEKIYTVQPTDTCNSIGLRSGISWLTVIAFNGMVDQWCSNLWKSVPSWGHTLCVSPPGGTFISIPTNTSGGDLGGQGGTGDGYAVSIAALPAGAVLATGTTANCGQFYTAKVGDTCASIFTLANTPSDLFIQANPSLISALKCSSNVVPGRTYCVHPVRGWDKSSSSTAIVTTSAPSTQSSTTSKPTTTTTSTSNGITTPSPIQTGMVKTCNTFYKVQSGDQCGTVAAAKGISLADLYAWNPAVGATCQFLQLDVYVCVNIIGGTTTSTCAGVALATPTPSASLCGVKANSIAKTGTGALISYTSGIYVSDAQACAAICQKTATCTNFYFILNAACNLKYGPVSYVINNTGVNVYNLYTVSCFACSTCHSAAIASPPPAGAACNVQANGISQSGTGTLVAYTAGSPHVASIEACGVVCMQTATCTNVYFISGKNCNLKYGPLAYVLNTSGVNAYSLYAMSCFTCTY